MQNIFCSVVDRFNVKMLENHQRPFLLLEEKPAQTKSSLMINFCTGSNVPGEDLKKTY